MQIVVYRRKDIPQKSDLFLFLVQKLKPGLIFGGHGNGPGRMVTGQWVQLTVFLLIPADYTSHLMSHSCMNIFPEVVKLSFYTLLALSNT